MNAPRTWPRLVGGPCDNQPVYPLPDDRRDLMVMPDLPDADSLNIAEPVDLPDSRPMPDPERYQRETLAGPKGSVELVDVWVHERVNRQDAAARVWDEMVTAALPAPSPADRREAAKAIVDPHIEPLRQALADWASYGADERASWLPLPGRLPHGVDRAFTALTDAITDGLAAN